MARRSRSVSVRQTSIGGHVEFAGGSRPQERGLAGENTKECRNTPHPPPPLPYVSNSNLRRFRLYVPLSLGVRLHKHLGGFSPSVHDPYRWVVSTVIYQTVALHAADRDGYVRLHWETVGSIVGRHKAAKVLHDLLAWRVLERSSGYQKGERSYGYRLHSTLVMDKVRLEWVQEPKLAARIEQNTRRHNEACCELGPSYQVVMESVRKVRIDGAKARRASYKAYRAGSDALVARRIAIDALERGAHYFIVEPRSRRAYHNVCNLASDLRRFLTVDQEPMGQVDIANSQPLFFWLEFIKHPSMAKEEAAGMVASLLAGIFYEEMNITGKPRETFKKEFFRDVLFGTGKYTSEAMELFKVRYPTFHKLLMESKREGHEQLPIAMQRAEARVVFKAVELFAKRTGGTIPVMTIHDSLVTTIRYLELAREVLHEVFQELHGIRPMLRIKPFVDERRKSA